MRLVTEKISQTNDVRLRGPDPNIHSAFERNAKSPLDHCSDSFYSSPIGAFFRAPFMFGAWENVLQSG